MGADPEEEVVTVQITRQADFDRDTRHRKIEVAAYFKAERRGFAPGHELDDWLAAEERLHAIGWFDSDYAFTDLGRERRAWIEVRTDELAAAPYDAIGADGCARLRELVRPFSKAMMAAFG